MKNNIILAVFATMLVVTPLAVNRAQALSCLPVEAYLADVVGKDEILIFSGTAVDKMESDNYTAEIIKIDQALQGWVEDSIFVYHQKDKDWGYLCNNGPKEKGSRGIYVAERNQMGKYNVYQRLELTDPLVATLKADLETKEVEGGVGELSATDRMNQIMTSVNELFAEIVVLLREYIYWKSN